jgi:hypothetical protein
MIMIIHPNDNTFYNDNEVFSYLPCRLVVLKLGLHVPLLLLGTQQTAQE